MPSNGVGVSTSYIRHSWFQLLWNLTTNHTREDINSNGVPTLRVKTTCGNYSCKIRSKKIPLLSNFSNSIIHGSFLLYSACIIRFEIDVSEFSSQLVQENLVIFADIFVDKHFRSVFQRTRLSCSVQ